MILAAMQGVYTPMEVWFLIHQAAFDRLANTIMAVDTDGFGQSLFEWLNAICPFDNFTIVAYFQDRAPKVFLTKAQDQRVFERIDSHYIGGAYKLDPFYGLHVDGAAEYVYRLSDIAPDQFQRNEYYKSYYERTTLIDELAFLSRPAPGISVTVCVGRDATSALKFSRRQIRDAAAVAPTVNALVKRNWRDLDTHASPDPENVTVTLRQRLADEKGISLSNRQSEIAVLILRGHSSVSIGLALGISPQTVKVIRKQLYKKCSISSQGELYYLIAPYLSSAVP